MVKSTQRTGTNGRLLGHFCPWSNIDQRQESPPDFDLLNQAGVFRAWLVRRNPVKKGLLDSKFMSLRQDYPYALLSAVAETFERADRPSRAVAVYICQGPHLFPSRTQ